MAVLDVNVTATPPPIPTGNTLWVDAVNGNDGTALPERQDKPYLTLAAAKAAATSGDTIHVRAGIFNETNIAKNGVRMEFDPGASVAYSGSLATGVIDDSTGAIVAKFTGRNDLGWSSDASSDAGTIKIIDPNSNIDIEAGVLSMRWTGSTSPGHPPGVIWGIAGKAHIKATEIVLENSGLHSGEYVIGWVDGDLHVEADIIRSDEEQNFGGVAGVDSPAETTGEFWVRANKIQTGVSLQSPGSDARMWVEAMDISVNGEGVQPIYAGGGRLYVRAMRVKNLATNGIAMRNEGGILWASIEKLTASGASGQGISLISGTSDLDILQIEDGGGLGAAIYCEAGTHVIKNTRFTSGGTAVAGVSISGGTLVLENCVIDTSGSPTGNPVVISGGTLILRGTKLVPASGQDAIQSGGSHTIKAEASSYTEGVSAGISFDGDMFFDQGGPNEDDVATANADGSWSWAAGGGGGAVASVFGRTGAVVAVAGDYTATEITNTPAGGISAVTVQAALNELDTEKQPIDSDLTTIAGLTPSNDDIIQRKAGAWTNRTMAQVKTDLVLVKGDVGLGNVDNTSDANKPVSTAQQTAIDAKVADAINDGTTTIAPSQNAVFDALALKQPLDAELTAIAGLTSAANKTIQFTGSGTAALIDLNNPGSQTLAATVTITAGGAPTGANNTYNWTRIGNLVTYQFTLAYSGAATTATNLLIAFPADMPAPFEQSGLTGASANLYPTTLRTSNGATGATTNTSTGSLRRNAGDTAYEFNVGFGSATLSHFMLFGSYFTA